ncbi:MAG: hypothetical protein FWC08_01745 [Defluviitaleaceae bacterium]|nr:hypothetical protein [Defluviitaleaceae bacterium]
MNKNSFSIGNTTLIFRAEDEITEHINYLLRNHRVCLTEKSEYFVDVIIYCGDFEKDTFDLKQITISEYLCNIASNFKENKPQRFYYLVLLKIILQVLSPLSYVSVHGTLVHSEELGSLLFIGNSGGGKSTLATSWLDQGYSIMGDDMIFIDKNGDCFPLLRDLHIESSLAYKFSNLLNLPACEVYMPGYTKLGYDWVKYHSDLVLMKTKLPNYIIESNISNSGISYISVINDISEKQAILSNLNEHSKSNNLSDILIEAIMTKHFTKIYWSSDIWEYKKRHFGFIHDSFSSQH